MPQDTRDENSVSCADAVESAYDRLIERQRFPLVRTQERLEDGRIAVEVFDRARFHDSEEPAYDFYVRDATQALEWIQQMAGKAWITKEHLSTFATLMIGAFGPGVRPVGRQARA